jgi:hypothetical protein
MNLMKAISIIFIFILISVNLTGCIGNEPPNDNGMENNGSGTKTEFERKVEQINNKTLEWLDDLDVNPIELRYEIGIKGKKKFVELLDSYLILYQTATTEENKSKYRNITRDLVQVTYDPKYHDMNEINDTQFRQDSTSYLRAWYIMNQFGLNTSHYEAEIQKVLTRLDNHLSSRGINQKMVFVFYYHRLGYTINYSLEGLFTSSVIREREQPEKLDELYMYFITHEVFVLFDDDQMSILTNDDKDYLKSIIPYCVNKTISEKNVDLLAEIIMIMTYLEFHEMDEYKTALKFLMNSQNDDGSFGDYEYARIYYEELGISVEIYLYLHTTEVSLRAINEAVDVFDIESNSDQ